MTQRPPGLPSPEQVTELLADEFTRAGYEIDDVVVDAGTASEDGKTVGDLAPEVYERDDLTVTPEKGGVGPLTVCALFENVIRAVNE